MISHGISCYASLPACQNAREIYLSYQTVGWAETGLPGLHTHRKLARVSSLYALFLPSSVSWRMQITSPHSDPRIVCNCIL